MSARPFLVAVLLAALTALAAGPAAADVQPQTTLAVQGRPLPGDQAAFIVRCASDDEFIAGLRGSTSFDALRALSEAIVRASGGAVQGVRQLGIRCRQVQDGGQVSGLVDRGGLRGYATEALFGIQPPPISLQCGLLDGSGVVQRPGVAHGIFGWTEPGDGGFVRVVGLDCMFADTADPSLADRASPVSAADPAPTPDFDVTCPSGQAAMGIVVRTSQLSNPFDTRDVTSVQLECRDYPRVEGTAVPSEPTAGGIVDLLSGARLVWRQAAGAVVYRVCTTGVGTLGCAVVHGESLELDRLVGGAAVGRRFAWSVQACALDPRPGGTAPRVCGTRVELPGGLDLGVRVAPPRPRFAFASPLAGTLDRASRARLHLRWTGSPHAERYRVRVTGGGGEATAAVAPEPGTGSGPRRVDVAVPVRVLNGGRRALARLSWAVRACADDPLGAETCGTKVPGNPILVDRARRVCKDRPSGTCPVRPGTAAKRLAVRG